LPGQLRGRHHQVLDLAGLGHAIVVMNHILFIGLLAVF